MERYRNLQKHGHKKREKILSKFNKVEHGGTMKFFLNAGTKIK